jgi:hypothetical protein
MHADNSQIFPLLIAALAVLMTYRRLRRSFGRQPVRPVRMKVRIGLLLILGISLGPLAMRSREFLSVEIAGLAAGIAMALWGAKRTRYERRGEQLYYLPHTYTGIAVTLLVLGRLVYRFAQVSSMRSARGFVPPSPVQSPITVGLLFVLIGYYICYYCCVLWKAEHLRTEDLEESPAASV